MKRTTPEIADSTNSTHGTSSTPSPAQSAAHTFLNTLIFNSELTRFYKEDSEKLIYLLENRNKFELNVFNHLYTILQTRITCILRIEPIINYYTQLDGELNKWGLGNIVPDPKFLGASTTIDTNSDRSIQFESNGSLLITTSSTNSLTASTEQSLAATPKASKTAIFHKSMNTSPMNTLPMNTSPTNTLPMNTSPMIPSRIHAKVPLKINPVPNSTTTSTTIVPTPLLKPALVIKQTKPLQTQPKSVMFDSVLERPPSPPPRALNQPNTSKVGSPEEGEIVDHEKQYNPNMYHTEKGKKPKKYFMQKTFPCAYLFQTDPSDQHTTHGARQRIALQHRKYGLNIRKEGSLTYVGCPYENCQFLHYVDDTKYASSTNSKLWTKADEDEAYDLAKHYSYQVINHLR
jgi:hypothetical protein